MTASKDTEDNKQGHIGYVSLGQMIYLGKKIEPGMDMHSKRKKKKKKKLHQMVKFELTQSIRSLEVRDKVFKAP